MKTKALFIFLALTLITVNVFSYDMILTGDPVLEDIRFLALETGTLLLSYVPPLSPFEIRKILDLIDESSLSLPALQAYERIEARLSPVSRVGYSNELFKLLLDFNVILETRIKSNSDISWYPLYPNITPFIGIPFKLSFADSAQLFLEVPFSVKHGSGYGTKDAETNFPFTGSSFSQEYMPVRCFFSAGNHWWNFFIGRERLYWGTAKTGSLVFNDNSTLFDFAKFSIFSSTVKYSMVINQMPLTLREDLFPSPSHIENWDTGLMHTMQRYYFMHRIDFTVRNKVTISLMEGLMSGNSFELRYLNPFVVFHTLYTWNDYPKWEPNNGDMTGSLFCLEVNWNITKKLSAYGQFVMNELALQGEINNNPEQPPNGFGYLTGIQYSHSFNTWGSIFYLEFIYTDPYLNLLSTPFGSYIQMDGDFYYYIGYPRDTIAVTLGSEFFNRDYLRFTGSFSWISSGEHNKNGLKWNWEKGSDAWNQSTPTGIIENKFILSFGAQWRPMSYLSIKTDIAGILSLNNRNIKGSDEFGAQAKIAVGFHY